MELSESQLGSYVKEAGEAYGDFFKPATEKETYYFKQRVE